MIHGESPGAALTAPGLARPCGRSDVPYLKRFSLPVSGKQVPARLPPPSRRAVVHLPRPCEMCGEAFTPRRSDARFCSGRCRVRNAPGREPVVSTSRCRECGVGFVWTNRHKRVFCSPACCGRAGGRDYYHRIRAGSRPGERITTLSIAERDGWRCHLCHRKVSREQATLDHLNPVSLGGLHVRENVALAHRRCNNVRSNRGPAQLRLMG